MVSPTAVADISAAFGGASAVHLGSGTFGETWLVDPVHIAGVDVACAVKLLHPHTFDRRLVEREVGGLGSYDDPRVVRLHEVQSVEVAGTERVALVCEYIEGGHVASNLGTGLPDAAAVVEFAMQMLGAVRLLHEDERVHRDIKLENIILRGGSWDAPVLIDFGLSKSASDATFTRYPQRVGSLPYMAPEVLAGDPPRKAADLWACGVVLSILLTGKHPYIDDFKGLSEEDVAEQVSGPPRALPAGTPEVLEELVSRLLSEEPYARGSARRAHKDLRKATR